MKNSFLKQINFRNHENPLKKSYWKLHHSLSQKIRMLKFLKFNIVSNLLGMTDTTEIFVSEYRYMFECSIRRHTPLECSVRTS